MFFASHLMKCSIHFRKWFGQTTVSLMTSFLELAVNQLNPQNELMHSGQISINLTGFLHMDAYRQPEKRSEYQTLVLNYRPFGNAFALFFFRRRARLRSCAYYFHCSIEKRCTKLGRYDSFNESHVLYYNKCFPVPFFFKFLSVTTNANGLQTDNPRGPKEQPPRGLHRRFANWPCCRNRNGL